MRYWKGDIETASPAEREARNLAALGQHLEQVAQRSPFYRRRFEAAGLRVDRPLTSSALLDLPMVSKQEIIDDQHGGSPYGSLIACDPAELVRLYISPGPQATYFTQADLTVTAENAAWVFWTNGFRERDVVDVAINYHWVIAGTIMDDAYRRIGCTTLPGGIGAAAQHLDHMRWARVTGLFAFPTFLEELQRAAESGGVDPSTDLHLRRCTIAGEMRSVDHRERMEAFWGGMTVREMYGGSEVPFAAAECELGVGMHLNPDLVVEVLHAETREPVGPGEPGVIVLSETARQAYPMIRYWTGDITSGVETDPCACGRTTPRIGRILGRVGEILRVKGLFLVPKEAARAVAEFEALGPFQLVVDRPDIRDELTVRVEHRGRPEERATLAAELTTTFKRVTRLTPTAVELVEPGTLEGTPTVEDRRA